MCLIYNYKHISCYFIACTTDQTAIYSFMCILCAERERGGGGGGEGKREGRVQNIHVSSYDIEHVFSKCDMHCMSHEHELFCHYDESAISYCSCIIIAIDAVYLHSATFCYLSF